MHRITVILIYFPNSQDSQRRTFYSALLSRSTEPRGCFCQGYFEPAGRLELLAQGTAQVPAELNLVFRRLCSLILHHPLILHPIF